MYMSAAVQEMFMCKACTVDTLSAHKGKLKYIEEEIPSSPTSPSNAPKDVSSAARQAAVLLPLHTQTKVFLWYRLGQKGSRKVYKFSSGGRKRDSMCQFGQQALVTTSSDPPGESKGVCSAILYTLAAAMCVHLGLASSAVCPELSCGERLDYFCVGCWIPVAWCD
ncbi:hypothetical protein BaRGS_00009490 [Batillaria attramentaria]|uniref:Uncharacterized protein n=1 Tax=Batillaria attramentaria TaxID=370345 RepID=A0ABD0LIN3_9CAEN